MTYSLVFGGSTLMKHLFCVDEKAARRSAAISRGPSHI
jgi:hypothetical protein